MATKDEKPGLLSKVAMFVRNPTKDWSELDQPEQPQESAYDKQALKAMIERKRQNDFVRKREFDQLRKLRNRDPGAMANMARPSFFQTSLPTDPDGRAVTLKKIDEIEAQMSKQWWKGKQEGDTTRAAALPVPAPSEPDTEDMEEHSQMPTQGPVMGAEAFEPTEAAGLRRRTEHAPITPVEFAATQMGSPMGEMSASASHSSGGVEHAYAGSNQGFSTSELFAIDVDDMETDPELEEAAIRFANGDDVGAERGLLEALRGDALQPEVALSWAAALLDLYRATNKRVQFDAAVAEFGMRFDRMTPQWAALADAAPSASAAAGTATMPTGAAGPMAWDCPAELSLAGMESLRDALSSQPPPWHVGWDRLESVAEDALPLMNGLFSSLCDEPVTFSFSGVDQLVERLRAMTPSGNRSVDRARWQVRLDALRAMNMQDEFELAALDYCVTFEVSPPAWTDARCHFENAAHAASHQHHTDAAGPATVSMGFEAGASHVLELKGEVLGDASQALTQLNEGGPRGGLIVVSCQGLVRVDFSAAGSILNWVATRQADGGRVQFRNVHRLVAAFFNVIGINEHAKVVPRPI